jgi:type VI protein secretion system component VasK
MVDDRVLPLISVVVAFWLVYFIQQLQQWSHTGPQAQLWLCIAIIATVVATIRFWRLLPIARRLNRGERGELHVAEVLEELRMDDRRVAAPQRLVI